MNLLTGQIEEIYIENGTTYGRVNVNGAYKRVPLFFLLEAKVGDTVLIEAGVGISIYQEETETDYVFSDTGKSRLN
ncbi:MAG: HypC/HybG/HupF family hydrogenase formation chaperone [Ignavibacteriae bacterium]|nr:HypC/HybG/HupF family hydrogenase formation chaperone [Ignavibacteriota bacterium]